MKLPQYDNRTPNTPLYSNDTEDSFWHDVKAPMHLIDIFIILPLSIVGVLGSIYVFVRHLLH